MDESAKFCVRCESPITADAPFETCSRCLVGSVLDEDDEVYADVLDVPEIAIEPGLPFELVGRYRLLRKLGEGAFGEVFAARQEGAVVRDVALKLLKRGMDSRQVVNRFEAERQALALMNHPNVAAVFDGGESPSGQPFFVLELVDGPPVTDYCQQHALGQNARLRLFLDICEGVQHAHQRGIIHRDLKPQNVLVACGDGDPDNPSSPTPVVIDFGIAKVTDHVLDTRTMITEAGRQLGTPAYMSPEQATSDGADVDVRTDVYSLGALLYELLTGSPPFDQERLCASGYAAMVKIITEESPPRPELAGDIIWIVMKALEKERGRRYQSTRDLAADIRRFLDGAAVEARPPSTGYRLRKFARRHKGLISSAASVAAVLVAGIAVATAQAIRATKAERVAAERLAVSDAVYDFINDDLLAAALEEGVLGIETFLPTLLLAEHKIEGKLTGHPLVEAGARLTLARAHLGFGLKEPAERNARRSLDLYAEHLDAPDRRYVGAAVTLARSLLSQARYEPALAVAKRAIARLGENLDHGNRAVAMLIRCQDEALEKLGHDAAERLPNLKKILAAELDSREAWRRIVVGHQELSGTALGRGDLDEATRHSRMATTIAGFINTCMLWQESPRVSNIAVRNRLLAAGVEIEQTASPFQIRVRAWDLDEVIAELELPARAADMIKAWILPYRDEHAAGAELWGATLPDNPGPGDHSFVHVHALMLEASGDHAAAAGVAQRALQLAHQSRDFKAVPWIAANWSRLHTAAGTGIDIDWLPRSEAVTFGGNGHRYQRIEIPLSWRDARTVCERLGGHLVTVADPAENEFVFKRFATDRVCWLGASDEDEEGKWKWVSGEPFNYEKWGNEQPNGNYAGEHFLMFGNFKWTYPKTYYTLGDSWYDYPDHGLIKDSYLNKPALNVLMTYAVCEWDK